MYSTVQKNTLETLRDTDLCVECDGYSHGEHQDIVLPVCVGGTYTHGGMMGWLVLCQLGWA